jgi:primosomal protein N' (replication factor Y)
MLTTGFNFEKIGLICVLLVESELSYPSYDAQEKAYTNLRQLIGRGNRKSQETTIILQTFIPKNPLVQQLTSTNFKDFFQQTLIERKEFDYPPYKQMVTLEYRHKDSKKAL